MFSSVCVFDSLATQTAQTDTAQNQTETLPIGFDLFLLPKFFANAAAAADVDGKSFSALVAAAVEFRGVGSVHQQHQHHQQMEWKCRVFFWVKNEMRLGDEKLSRDGRKGKKESSLFRLLVF